MHTRQAWKSVVIWSIISSAFIGPGSVTTGVAAGSLFRLDLMWAVTFSTLACIAVQELAARITIATGLNLGETLVQRFGRRSGSYLQRILGAGVIIGCAAYEAGNIVGAVAGAQFLTGIGVVFLTLVISAAAFLVLWYDNPSWIFNLMAILVALMGVAFFFLAATQHFSPAYVLRSIFVPTVPPGSHLTIMALLGTTVVPYNIFLGSGISHGQTVPLMRIGLVISVVIGGLITAAVLVAGTSIRDFSSFENLYADVAIQVGPLAAIALALGLFGAGFSSAITSPYAAAIITKSVFEIKKKRAVKAVWIGVLLTGFVFGLSGLQPVAVIMVVQALNGFILPFLVIILLLIVNDPRITPRKFMHGWFYNVLLLIMLFGICLISLSKVDSRVLQTLNLSRDSYNFGVATVSLCATAITGWVLFRQRVGLRSV